MVGSIEGRVAVHHVEDAAQSKNFTFKCHRQDSDIYAVNAVTFHPVHGTFVTAGSDGSYNFWDKARPRLPASATWKHGQVSGSGQSRTESVVVEVRLSFASAQWRGKAVQA